MGNILGRHKKEQYATQFLKEMIKQEKEREEIEKEQKEKTLNKELGPGFSKRCVELIDLYYETRKYYPEKLDSLTKPLVVKFKGEKDEDIECFCTFIRRTTNDHLINKQKTNNEHKLEFDHCSYYHGDYWSGCLPKWVEEVEK